MTAVVSMDARTGDIVEVGVAETSDVVEVGERASASAESFTSDRPLRSRALRAIADALDSSRAELIDLADRETALGAPRLDSEISRTTGQLRAFADVVDDGSYLEVIISDPSSGVDLRRMLIPLGPVAVFSAINFPFAFSVVGGDTAAALAAGCPVVVKVHPSHAATSQLVGELARDALASAGADPDVLQLVYGFDAGKLLVCSSDIRAVAFTGSRRGGQALMDLIDTRDDPIPFFGELGSLNPFVVTEGAASSRAESIAAGLAESMLLGAGQFCTKPGLFFVPTGKHGDDFVAALEARIGDAGEFIPLDDRIRASYEAGVKRLAGLVELKAERVAASDRTVRAALVEVPPSAVGQLEEVFGPAGVVVRHSDVEQLALLLGQLQPSLVTTIHSDEAEVDVRARVLAVAVPRTGRVVFNDYPTGVAVVAAQHHGGPWPASSSSFTSVGSTSIRRFLRPIAFQGAPHDELPAELRG